MCLLHKVLCLLHYLHTVELLHFISLYTVYSWDDNSPFDFDIHLFSLQSFIPTLSSYKESLMLNCFVKEAGQTIRTDVFYIYQC